MTTSEPALTASPPPSLTPRTERILVVEDEALIRETVALALLDEGYEVETAADGKAALDSLCVPPSEIGDAPIDLAILDLMLPEVNGLDLCRYVRQQGLTLPILILSAKSSEMDRVVGLEVGADDYLAKPFGMKELIARCRALLRRHQRQLEPTQAIFRHQDITLYLNELRVTVGTCEVGLSPKEYRILELFMSHPRRVWSREQLIEKVWGPDFMGDRKTVDVHIRWLREKIEPDPSSPKYITTLRGFGYRFG
jgi:two-component system phosphate regulon response regulator PhoB